MSLELIEIIIEGEETNDELFDLYPIIELASPQFFFRKRLEVLLLQVFKCSLQQVRNILLKELLVGCSWRSLSWWVNRVLHFARFNKIEHARQKHSLGFESCIFINQ